jgi:RNA methyltransferase, TrmH family
MASGGWQQFLLPKATTSQLQQLRRLVGRRDARLEACVCVVEGWKVLAEAIASGRTVREVFVPQRGSISDEFHSLPSGRALFETVTYAVTEAGMTKVSDTVSPPQVVAIVDSPLWQLVDLSPLPQGLVVVGVDIRDPGNAGTMIRSAELSGAIAAVFLGTSVDLTSPKVVRSSAGALFHIPTVQSDDVMGSLAYLNEERVRLLGTAMTAERSYTDAGVLSGSVAVVMGNEGHGLDKQVGSILDGWIMIPMQGRTESLNVGMATSVLCFEAARQRAGT